jgi:hypothetical protein
MHLLDFASCVDYARDMLILMLLLTLAAPLLVHAEELPAPSIVCDAVCRYPTDKIRENQDAIDAGKRQAEQWTQAQRAPGQAYVEQERNLALFESRRAMPMMPTPMMLSCTSATIGMFGNLDCF